METLVWNIMELQRRWVLSTLMMMMVRAMMRTTMTSGQQTLNWHTTTDRHTGSYIHTSTRTYGKQPQLHECRRRHSETYWKSRCRRPWSRHRSYRHRHNILSVSFILLLFKVFYGILLAGSSVWWHCCCFACCLDICYAWSLQPWPLIPVFPPLSPTSRTATEILFACWEKKARQTWHNSLYCFLKWKQAKCFFFNNI